jgi:hypothetical protein
MTKAADGLTTATEHAKPSRRRALTLLAASGPVLAMVGSSLVVAANADGQSEIARLFAEWQAEYHQHDAALKELSEAEERAHALYPERPAILWRNNAPASWQNVISRHGFPGDRLILVEEARELAAGKSWHIPDDWSAKLVKTAERWEAAKDAADEMSGHNAAQLEWTRSIDALMALAERIAAIVPRSLEDVQMQIVVVKDRHEDWQVGPLEEKLFASILAASSAFSGRAV